MVKLLPPEMRELFIGMGQLGHLTTPCQKSKPGLIGRNRNFAELIAKLVNDEIDCSV